MNKIFKVVWSKTKECYVVVSEVAKNNGGKKKALASVLAGLAMVAATAGTPVQADGNYGGSAVNITPNAYNGSNRTSPNSVVVGYQNDTTGGSGNGHVIYGANNVANQDSSMALGNQNVATGPAASAIGVGSQATGRNTIAVGNVAKASNTDNIAIGTYSEALTSGQDAYALAVGSYSKANAHMAVGVGALANATGTESTAVGAGSKATAKNSQAFGARNTASGQNATAIGYGNTSKVEDTITIGTSNNANTGGGIAIGQNNLADATANGGRNAGSTQIAIGRDNRAAREDTIAIGREAKAENDLSVAIGNRTEATANAAIAIGTNGAPSGGNTYKTTASGFAAVAIGMQANSSGTASTAVGGKSSATANGASALGQASEASAASATALGKEAKASVADGVALGSQSKATVDKGVKGFNPAETRTNKYAGLAGTAQTSTLAAVSVGDGANATRQITGLAAGTADSDAVNVAQLRSVNLKYAGDTGNSDVLLDNGTLNVKGDDKFISTSADKNGVKITAKVGENITTNADGKAVAPTTNGIATTDNVTQAINNSGWKVTSANNGGTTNGTTSEKVSPGDTVTFKAGKNIVLDQAGKQFTYSLNKDVDLTNGGSLTIGDTKVNNDGLTITGGPSVTKIGINAGNKKITNVAPGTDDTDAVNVKQLKSAKTEVKAGNGVTVAKTQDTTDGHDIYTVSSTGATGNTDPSKVEGGKNTTVTGDGTAATPYKVNVQGDLTDISSITNGTGSGKISFAGDQVVKVEGDNPISLDGKGGYVTGLQNKDWDITNPTVVSGRAATEDQLKKVSDGFNNTIKLAGNTGNTDTQKFNKTGGLSFGVVGANNGQYIKTTASGTDVVADLSDDAKTKLNKTYTVSSGSTNVTVTPTTVGDNTDFKISVTNPSTPGGASSTESVVKKADAAGDTNLADIAVENGKNSGDPDAKYSVNVSRNAVKDAAREAVTVNNGGTTTGGNYTADADNPITVNPVKDDAKHNTTYEVKFDGEKAAKQIPLTYKANGTGDQTVKLDKGLNFTNGSNTTASVAADGVVKYDLNKDVDLTKNGSLTIGDTKVNNDGVTITGGPSVTKTGINAGNKKITNVAPATDGTDAVNYDQLKAARTVVTSNDKSVTINKTTNGDQVTYDLHVNAAAGTASTWNLKSGAVSATEGTHSGDTDQNIADGKSVTMQAGKNLTVTQTNDGNGNTEVAYALDKDLKDLDSVTTKEVKLGDKNNNISIKKDGDRITYSTDGGTTVKKVANLDDEKHIKPGSYAVQNDGSVTMTYVDGNGKPVTGEEAKITGIAKNDLSNITDDGKKVITGLGSKVEAGDNVTVTDTTDATTGQKTYTVNAKLAKIENGKNTTKTGTGTDADPYKINVEGDLTDINSITNGAGSGKLTFGPNETVTVGGTNPITLNAKTGNIGGLTNKTFDPNNIVSGQAATEDQLKSAHDSLKASELHIAPTAVKAGSTEAKGGVVNGTENVYKYDAGTKKVTLTYNDGNGKAVTDTKAVIDFSDLNIPAAGNNYSFKTNATGNLEDGSNATETEVASGKTVNFGAGKNLTVKQEIGKDGNQTYTYALNKDLTNLDKVVVNGKDGQPGKDGVTITGPQGAAGTDGNNGKVGISGKDGKDAVSISGKDGVGHIGLTGPAGKDGKNATADITVKDGVPGVDGQPGETMTRIVYQDKDGNEHEVATHDDGMKFAGDDGQTDATKVIKKHLNNVVDIVGGADKAKLTDKNIGVNNDNGKLKVQLSKDLDLTKDGSVKIGDTKVNNDGLTITNVKQLKDKVTTVESSDGTISVTDKNDPTSATYDAAKGHQYDIKINNQGVVNNAQLPVVYTKQDGTKVYKQPDGTFNTAKDGSGTVVAPNEVIASMNSAGDSTTAPTKLNN
ncbi:MAG: ESPR-type extended signal peptide-containing protein, partial [Veillonella sp.]|uniref:ESPR-type extended signal peptide-containing protein n=2 Tax=Veillonella sp. TaxID=1926307 RepID=UPI0029039F06